MPSRGSQIPLFFLPSLRRGRPDESAVISVNVVGVFQLAGLQATSGPTGGFGRLFRNPLKFRDYRPLGFWDTAALPASHISIITSVRQTRDVRTSASCSERLVEEIMEGFNEREEEGGRWS